MFWMPQFAIYRGRVGLRSLNSRWSSSSAGLQIQDGAVRKIFQLVIYLHSNILIFCMFDSVYVTKCQKKSEGKIAT